LNVIGRAKTTGAPLSGGGEFTTPDFTKRDDQGNLVIPRTNAHIRLASHEENGGTRLRRPERVHHPHHSGIFGLLPEAA
jgi:deferrochelatase/peroxidase EfeB